MTLRHLHTLICIALAGTMASCGGGTGDGQTVALYRNSITDENMRLHVATFDATDGEAYNRGNCEQAQQLFQAQQGVKTKFWCEKGRFKK